MVRFFLLSSLTFFTALIPKVKSHGGLISPRSRNQVAREEGTDVAQSGVPVKEYCWHCLNRNNGMCGKIDGNDYDMWIDSTGNPMPWKPQATYQRGEIITVETAITAHHWGHIELHACPKGRQSTQGCLDSYPLEFVEDVDYDLPQDPNYPERGYLAGRHTSYTMKFRLPSNLVGDQVLLQWHYITSNSCLPPGYIEYYDNISSSVGRSKLSLQQCSLPYANDGLGYPEQFWNCAEISVVGGSSPPPPIVAPVKAPAATAPVKRPFGETLPAPVELPIAAPVSAPVNPMKAPVSFPTSTTSGEGCCSYDYKTCINNPYWCGSTESECLNCDTQMIWLSDGGLEGQSCASRYQTCTTQACCPGLICDQKNAYYSQCVAP